MITSVTVLKGSLTNDDLQLSNCSPSHKDQFRHKERPGEHTWETMQDSAKHEEHESLTN